MLFNRSNFHKRTFCIFRETELPGRKPDFVSKSGSSYWFDNSGVYRSSNHWGRAANCKWRLVSASGKASRQKTGYAEWGCFAPDNDHEKLYFLKPDGSGVKYFHKDVSGHSGELLRTSADTMRRIRKIREYLKENEVSQEFLNCLLNTDLPVHQINGVLPQTDLLTLGR